jgi:putative ABC transport system substrate-binding protein
LPRPYHRFIQALIGYCLSLVLLTHAACASELAVVLSDDSAPYQEVFEAIKARMDDREISVARLYANGLSEAALNARLVVVVGVRAAEAAAATASHTPLLAVLVPRDWYRKRGRQLMVGNEHRTVSAIYLDQPYERQVRLIHLAFPDVRRVGVLVSTAQAGELDEIGVALRSQGISLVSEVLESGQKLIAPLERLHTSTDLLLAVPDPDVFNRNTAQSIFLTSYRYRDPIVGYSRALARAGAMLALYSTPAQIGRQAAELLIKQLTTSAKSLPAPAFPHYFSVAVNQQVARSLGYDVPSETDLERSLEGGSDD